MAKTDLNTALSALRGNLGGYVFKQYGSKTVISRMPQMDHIKPSPAQIAQRARFRAASVYYRKVLADPVLKKRFSAVAKKQGHPLSSVVMADFLRSESTI